MRCLPLIVLISCAGSEPVPPHAAPSAGPAEAAEASVPQGEALDAPIAEPSDDAERVDEAERAVARHLLVAYAGAQRAALGVNRSREEAEALAEQYRARALAGEPLAELAKRHSDGPTKGRGGFLGSAARGSWAPAFEDAVWALPVGGLSEVVETPYGFHVIQREALQEARVRHVVVQHVGARGVGANTPAGARSAAEAEARAEEALEALEAGEDFAEVAARFSDGPMALRGGELGWFVKGDLGPSFDEAVFALAPGERSGLITTPFGVHVVERVE